MLAPVGLAVHLPVDEDGRPVSSYGGTADMVLLSDQRCATPGLANATGPGTAPPPRAPAAEAAAAAAETCTALTGQRGAVAKRSLIRLRKQKLLRQVFERLQDQLLCTFLKAD